MTKIKLEDLKPDDVIVADEGFTCIKPGPHTVKGYAERPASLYVECDKGDHYLMAQTDREGYLIGFTRQQ